MIEKRSLKSRETENLYFKGSRIKKYNKKAENAENLY